MLRLFMQVILSGKVKLLAGGKHSSGTPLVLSGPALKYSLLPEAMKNRPMWNTVRLEPLGGGSLMCPVGATMSLSSPESGVESTYVHVLEPPGLFTVAR